MLHDEWCATRLDDAEPCSCHVGIIGGLRAEVERLRGDMTKLLGERDALAWDLSHLGTCLVCPGCARFAQRALEGVAHHAERVRLERAVVEAARGMIGVNFAGKPVAVGFQSNVSSLDKALAALDAHERKEQAE